MGAVRNGSAARRRGRPPNISRVSEGEKGTSYTNWNLELVPGDLLGKQKKPTPAELDEMISTDGWALAMYGVLTWPIRRCEWTIVEAEGDTGEAELCREQLGPLLARVVAGMCQAIGHSVSYAELVWERGGESGVFLKDVAFRPVATCKAERDKNGRVIGFKQVAWTEKGMVNEKFFEVERKAFIYAHDSTTSPKVGKSAFETAYHYYVNKRKILFYRFKNLEKFGGPTTVGKTNAVGDEFEAFEESVANARSGASIVTGLDEEIVFMQTPQPGVSFRQTITDLNFEMAVSTLVQFLSYAQEGNSGSYNASSIQMEVLEDVTEGRISEIETSIQELCVHVCEVARGVGSAVPKIKAERIAEEPKKLAVDAVRTMPLFTDERPMPDWFAEALAAAFARILDIQKPEEAPWFGTPKPKEPEESDPAAKRSGKF